MVGDEIRQTTYLALMFPQPRSPGQLVSPLLKQVAMILSPVVKVAPAMMEPLYVMAQVKFLSGEQRVLAEPGGASALGVSTGSLPGILFLSVCVCTHPHTYVHTCTHRMLLWRN